MNNIDNGIIQFTNIYIYMNNTDNGFIQIGGKSIVIFSCFSTFSRDKRNTNKKHSLMKNIHFLPNVSCVDPKPKIPEMPHLNILKISCLIP